MGLDCMQFRAAPTVVCAQRYQNESKTAVPEDPGASAMVFPHRDNVLVFDGSLAHGVVHGPPSGTRMTLLINWWEQHPQVRVFLRHPGNCRASASASVRDPYARPQCYSKRVVHQQCSIQLERRYICILGWFDMHGRQWGSCRTCPSSAGRCCRAWGWPW